MESEELMEHMSIFCEQSKVRALLQEYMRRIILERPDDPIGFLIEEIQKNPYQPKPEEIAIDNRTTEEQAKGMDTRSVEEKVTLLRQLFAPYANSGHVDRGAILVGLKSKPSVLLEYFPRHATDILRCIETIPAQPDGRSVSWEAFLEATLDCLSKPGLGPK
mmetsp:Transcript_12873/g.19292  ORF Transcript_12873/g.19292 Transcript_12873/m.19292 type:complete len:162 (-) Transcript_12873:39-524(-)